MNNALKYRQDTIAGSVHNSAIMLGDRLAEDRACALKSGNRGFLVVPMRREYPATAAGIFGRPAKVTGASEPLPSIAGPTFVRKCGTN